MYKDISNGKWRIVIDPEYPTTKTDKEAAIARAEARIGERNYKLLANNCENFARDVLIPGKGFSRQVGNFIFGIGGVITFFHPLGHIPIFSPNAKLLRRLYQTLEPGSQTF